MKRFIVATIATSLLLLGGGITALADNEDVFTNPSNRDSVGYCVTNHKFIFFGTVPNSVGLATFPRRGDNSLIYREGGVADAVCTAQGG
jgi:hypothetical protein